MAQTAQEHLGKKQRKLMYSIHPEESQWRSYRQPNCVLTEEGNNHV